MSTEDEKIKVTFEVQASREPELVAWLKTLPYGKISKGVRSVLSVAAKFNAKMASPHEKPVEPAEKTPASRKNGGVVAPRETGEQAQEPIVVRQEPRVVEAVINGENMIDAPKGHASMTAAVAQVMLDMDKEFG
jgi:hypothetical protein